MAAWPWWHVHFSSWPPYSWVLCCQGNHTGIVHASFSSNASAWRWNIEVQQHWYEHMSQNHNSHCGCRPTNLGPFVHPFWRGSVIVDDKSSELLCSPEACHWGEKWRFARPHEHVQCEVWANTNLGETISWVNMKREHRRWFACARLSVHRLGAKLTPKNIYSQLIQCKTSETLHGKAVVCLCWSLLRFQ